MLNLTERSSRLPSLTGLRFVAAFMVLADHVGTALVPRVAPEEWILPQIFYASGVVGVSFFFILSGFVLTWVARPDDTAPLFWRRRLVKIFPNHLVTFAASIALMAVAGVALTADLVPMLLLVQSWIPSQDLLLDFHMNAPTWSLACELLFYLCFPLLLPLIMRIRADRLWAWIAGVGVAIAAVPAIATLLPGDELMFGMGEPWLRAWFMYFLPPVRMLEFVLGILMARVVLSGRWIRLGMTPAALFALLALLLSAYLPDSFGDVAATAIPLALLIAAAATADIAGRRTLTGGRAMVWLGEISYAFYMVHWLVVVYGPIDGANPAGWEMTSTLPAALADAGITLAACLVLAWLLYTLVERPAMRRWSRPASALSTPATATDPDEVPPESAPGRVYP